MRSVFNSEIRSYSVSKGTSTLRKKIKETPRRRQAITVCFLPRTHVYISFPIERVTLDIPQGITLICLREYDNDMYDDKRPERVYPRWFISSLRWSNCWSMYACLYIVSTHEWPSLFDSLSHRRKEKSQQQKRCEKFEWRGRWRLYFGHFFFPIQKWIVYSVEEYTRSSREK